jgi:spore coat protein U-like protein
MMRTRRSVVVFISLFVALAALSSPARAALFLGSCSASFAATLNFGTYDTINPIAMPGQNLSVTCNGSGSTTVSATLSIGSGTYAQRTMSSATSTDVLNYNLYADAAYTQIIGDGSAGTSIFGPKKIHPRLLRPQTLTFPIYGLLPGNQNVTPGTYTSAPIVITVLY